MFDKLVIPLDGSRLAERALAPATALAKHYGAVLHLVRVPVLSRVFVAAEAGYGLLYPDQSMDIERSEAARYLEAVQNEEELRDLPINGHVVEGDVAGSVVDTAAQIEAGLVVMSSHGYSGLTRWLMGSVAERVLRAAPCPVWIVRATQPMRHVLVTLDGSASSEAVLAPAAAIARCFGADLTLLRAVPYLDEAEIDELNGVERGLGQRLLDETNEAAQDYLVDAACRHGIDGPETDLVVRSGSPADVILKYAELKSFDLVAMATHGRTGLRRWRYGSVTEKVLHSLTTSMLVVRPPENWLT
jgi:nucleotide-binding universal stress UspA family protein